MDQLICKYADEKEFKFTASITRVFLEGQVVMFLEQLLNLSYRWTWNRRNGRVHDCKVEMQSSFVDSYNTVFISLLFCFFINILVPFYPTHVVNMITGRRSMQELKSVFYSGHSFESCFTCVKSVLAVATYRLWNKSTCNLACFVSN